MSKIQLADLKAFEARLEEEVPGFQVRFKDESKFMKLLGFLTFMFNPKFMTSYTTTVERTVYFASREKYEQNPESSFRTLAHEYVHIADNVDHGLWFSVSYLLPQILLLLPFAAFGVFAWPHTWILLIPLVGYGLANFLARRSLVGAWSTLVVALVGAPAAAIALVAWWKVLLIFGGLLFTFPWPAPWRTKWELRGYSMSLAITLWRQGWIPSIYRENCITQFTGPNYFFMSWRRASIERSLDAATRSASDGTLRQDRSFNVVYQFLSQRNLLHV